MAMIKKFDLNVDYMHGERDYEQLRQSCIKEDASKFKNILVAGKGRIEQA